MISAASIPLKSLGAIAAPTDSLVDITEEKLRLSVYTLRVRILDFFHDFDKLHSGNVTKSQFRRVLNRCGFLLREDEYCSLETKYLNKTNEFSYKPFVDNINTVFGECTLGGNKEAFFSTLSYDLLKRLKIKPEEAQSLLVHIVETLRQFASNHGSDIKSWFKDFDKHHSGLININQVFFIVLYSVSSRSPS